MSWMEWHWDRFLYEDFSSPLSITIPPTLHINIINHFSTNDLVQKLIAK